MSAKILLITPSTRTMAKLEMCLNARGHTVVPVARISDAAAILENDSTFDLLVCDFIPPGTDSLELLKNIRTNHIRKDLPVIFLLEEAQLLTDSLRKTAVIFGCNKFVFMDGFDAHRMQFEIEAVLPEQLSSFETFAQHPTDISPPLE